jgi:hypothetical protein
MTEQLALIEVPPMPAEWVEREVYYSRPEYVWPLCEYLSDLARRDSRIRACFDYGRAIVEPCVGGGALVDGLAAYWHGTDLDVLTGDVREIAADWQGDWTDVGQRTPWRWNRDVCGRIAGAGLVMSNPPFTPAKTIVEASWTLCPLAIVAMLLPARWYENTEDRGQWLRTHNPDRINIGRCQFFRPDVTSAGKGDSTTYEWYVWGTDKQGPRRGHHEIIDWREAPNP